MARIKAGNPRAWSKGAVQVNHNPKQRPERGDREVCLRCSQPLVRTGIGMQCVRCGWTPER